MPSESGSFSEESLLSSEQGHDEVTSDLFLSYNGCPWKDVRISRGSWFPY